MEVNVRKFILTTVSVLSLGVGAGMSLAADTTNVAPNAGSNIPAVSGTPSYSTTAMNSSSAEIRRAQQQLQNQGFYHGQIDGIVGPETEQAIGQFQLKNGLRQTATLDQPTMDKLLGNPVGSQSSGAPTVFHGGGTTTNPQPAGSGGNMPKQ